MVKETTVILKNTTERIMHTLSTWSWGYTNGIFGGRMRRFSFSVKLLIRQHPSQFVFHQHIATDDRAVASLRPKFPKYVSSTYTVLVLKDCPLRPFKYIFLSPSS